MNVKSACFVSVFCAAFNTLPAHARDRAPLLGPPDGASGLSLALTVAPDNGDPAQCGTQTSLSVAAGDQVNLCYRVSNQTGVDLSYQTVRDSLKGLVSPAQATDLPAGGSLQYNRVITASKLSRGAIEATWIAQAGPPGYDFDTTGPSRFVDISASGTPLDITLPDGRADVTSPFPFVFYGTTTNQLSVSVNGGLSIAAPDTYLTEYNVGLPSQLLNASAILPLWDDFAPSASGNVYYATLGEAPNRRFVVEWYQLPHAVTSNAAPNIDTATFEVVFDEASGAFSFEYADVEYSNANPPFGAEDADIPVCDGGLCATVGVARLLNDPTDVIASQYSYDTPSLHDGLSIVVKPSVLPNTFSATATATLDVVAPAVAVSPRQLAATITAGGSTSLTLRIANDGNDDLAWSIGQAPATGATAASGAQAHGSTAVPALAAGDATVPAYMIRFSSSLDTLDAAAPAATTPLHALSRFYKSNSFANNDFSTLYALYNGSLTAIDVGSGTETPLSSALDEDYDTNWSLRWDASTATMFAVGVQKTPLLISYLYTVDLATGVYTPVGESDGVFLSAIAFDNAGNLYGLDTQSLQLVAIDKANGDFQPIGPLNIASGQQTPIDVWQSMDFDPSTGVLWFAAVVPFGPSIMYTIDPSSGAATYVGPIGDPVNGNASVGFSIAVPAGGCAAPASVPWLSVTPATAVTAAGASSEVTVSIDAANLADGTYDATLCVTSNDRGRRLVGVPIEVTVSGDGDTIFKNGFDAASAPTGRRNATVLAKSSPSP